MAAVPVTLIGSVTYDNGTTQQVTFQGVAALTGLGVGGGPAQPPLGIWGGAPPYVDIGGPGSQPHPSHPIAPGGRPPYPSQGPGFPTHPIYLPPIVPGGPPIDAHPEHPIVLPPPTEGTGPEGGKPPPPGGGWGYHPTYGWGYFPAQGEPSPKAA
jgi:hypothetical protein